MTQQEQTPACSLGPQPWELLLGAQQGTAHELANVRGHPANSFTSAVNYKGDVAGHWGALDVVVSSGNGHRRLTSGTRGPGLGYLPRSLAWQDWEASGMGRG